MEQPGRVAVRVADLAGRVDGRVAGHAARGPLRVEGASSWSSSVSRWRAATGRAAWWSSWSRSWSSLSRSIVGIRNCKSRQNLTAMVVGIALVSVLDDAQVGRLVGARVCTVKISHKNCN